MTDAEKAAAREHLQRWQRVGPLLEEIRRRELREYDFAANRDIVSSLFQMGADHQKPRRKCGLVEWYRRLGVGG